MRTSRTNFDRQEARRDRRYAQPFLNVAIDGQDYVSDNWSLGGFHLTAKLPVEAGTTVTGMLRVDGADAFPFTAVVVRKDRASDAVAFRFQNLSPLAVSKLDRALARRLVRRR
jgi:hypothetical protein